MEAPEYHRTTTQFPQMDKLHQHQGGTGMVKTGTDHFMVEDLLDFSSNEEDAVLELAGGGEVEMEVGFDGNYGGDCSTVTTTTTGGGGGGGRLDCSSNESSGSVVDPGLVGGDGDCSGSLVDPCLSGELCVPYDELAELEWLSNIVEESFSSEDLEKLQLISGVKSSSPSEAHTEISTTTTTTTTTTITTTTAAAAALDSEKPPAKARSKRSRAAPVNWTSRLLLVQGSSPPTTLSESELLVPPPPQSKASKTVKKKESAAYDGLMPAPDGRKCLHCATDKTPQWRTGPLGPKTLCNACGVRFKSGRLVPEYRPAASPTFVMSKHSNSHRKVLELRRQKEIVQHQQQQGAQFLHNHHHPHPAAIYDAAVAGAGGGSDEFLNYHHLGPDFRQLI